MSLIEEKKIKAISVMSFLEETFENYKTSENEGEQLVGKKTATLIKNAKNKMKDITTAKEYIQAVTEISDKLINKANDEKINQPQTTDSLIEKLNWMNKSKFIVLFDIDDTIRDASHRLHVRDEIIKLNEKKKEYEKGSEMSVVIEQKTDSLWNDFFRLGAQDKPRKDMIELCNSYHDMGFEVKFRTGASDKYREETIQFLKDNGVKYHELRMRKEGVKIPAKNLKPSWITKYDGAENVFATYDDLEEVNEKYRKKGVVDTILVTRDFDVAQHVKDFKSKVENALIFINKSKEDLTIKKPINRNSNKPSI